MRVHVITRCNVLRGISDQLRIFTHLSATAYGFGGNFMAGRNKAHCAQVFYDGAGFQCMGRGDDVVGGVQSDKVHGCSLGTRQVSGAHLSCGLL